MESRITGDVASARGGGFLADGLMLERTLFLRIAGFFESSRVC